MWMDLNFLGAGLPIAEIAKDPYLTGTKIFYEKFPYDLKEENYGNIYVYNDDFFIRREKC